jgi:hypothetical protein
MTESRRIVVLGGMAQMPWAGVAWQVLHYLEGFRRLGHDVVYIEDTGGWPYDPDRCSYTNDAGPGARRLEHIMQRSGFGDRWAYRDASRDGAIWGMSTQRFDAALAEADVLVNLSGMTFLREQHMAAPVRIYLESDPVNMQIAVARGEQPAIDLLAPHTVHFSFGERLGSAACGVPVERFDYIPTRQPVVLDWWPPSEDFPQPPPGDVRFTTLANWEQTHRDVEWDGETYTWSKSVEFLKLLEVPRRAGVIFEPALDLDDQATIAMLKRFGWRVIPRLRLGPLSRDLDSYREFIAGSTAEFSAAKDQNVRFCTGWFSDRSATYLAAGRPVVVQDTGFDVALPTGEGILAFRTADEAVAAIGEVTSDYARHSRAARDVAEAYFGAEMILARLLEEARA